MKLRRILGLVLFLVAGVGFALAEETPSLWIDVPFVAQVKNGCGSAAIGDGDGVLGEKDRAHRARVSGCRQNPATLYSPAEEGIPASAMKRYLRVRATGRLRLWAIGAN